MKKLMAVLSLASLFSLSMNANAALIGIFGDSTTEASTIATNQGHTVTLINDFTDLSSFDVIWALNSGNSSHLSELSSFAANFENYVVNGGVLMYHDRFVTDADTVLPGLENVSFVRDLSSNIDVVGSNDVAKMDIVDTTLDGGNFSTHGHVLEASIDVPYTGIFSDGAGQLVDVSFEVSLGNVYYSAIPLDYYIAGNGSVPAFASVYAPNVLDFAVSLTEDGNNGTPTDVPAPLSLGLIALGLLVMRRKAK